MIWIANLTQGVITYQAPSIRLLIEDISAYTCQCESMHLKSNFVINLSVHFSERGCSLDVNNQVQDSIGDLDTCRSLFITTFHDGLSQCVLGNLKSWVSEIIHFGIGTKYWSCDQADSLSGYPMIQSYVIMCLRYRQTGK